MNPDSESESKTYEVQNDPVAIEAYVRAYRRAHKGKVANWIVNQAAWTIALPILSFLFGVYCSNTDSFAPGVWVLGIGAFSAFLYLTNWGLDCQMEASKQAGAGKTWRCTLTAEGWTFAELEGASTFIPWRAMKLVLETPAIWEVRYGKDSVLVFREPLRRAGLEQEFCERIGQTSG